MKKFFVLGLALAASLAATAQDDADIASEDANEAVVNKKGKVITPQTGDIGLSVEAAPFLDYAADLVSFNGANANAPVFNTSDNLNLVGRYFLDESTAIRARVRIDLSTETTQTQVDELDGNGAVVDDKFVIDKEIEKNTQVMLGAGIEKRRGYGRLQGFYGGEARLSFIGNSTVNTFGNDLLSIGRSNAADTDFQTADKSGLTMSLGLYGVVGAEYFVSRKVALGGEFTWGLRIQNGPAGTITTTSYDSDDDELGAEVVTTNIVSDESFLGFETAVGGNLYLSLYF